MKIKLLTMGIGFAAAMAAGAASAHTDVGVYLGVPGVVYQAPPPVVYSAPSYYAPQPVYYDDHERWEHRRWEERREDREHHDRGEHRGWDHEHRHHDHD